ncbi:MAG: ABC transporter ATP-binding protein [Actinomycetota bacterium]|nr:ABC transporter ATP-binding protein [Actinomycetota bacterium]
MTEPALLELSSLRVRYGAVPALHDVSFAVRAGEVVGVVGPNGAGKSTMLSAIMRVVGWSAGDIRFRGESLARCSSDQVARLGIALVPEGRQIFADLTVDENLRLGMVARRSRDGASDDLGSVFELFPVVGDFRDRPAGLLSGGQQQQLAIARALLADPDLLLLDEPSLGLAPTVIDAVFSSLDAVRRAGRTIVIVEQRAQRTIAFADRTYVLADGRIRAELGPDGADNGELLRAAYFGTDDGSDHRRDAS